VHDDLPVIAFASQKKWAGWLAKQHASSTGMWLKIAKVNSGIATVTYAEALDVALCYGWIDGMKDKFDDDYWLQRFTPRKPKSKWSEINCGKVAALIERGEMKPPGLREVEAAKADGRWAAAYAGQKTAVVPEDLRKALAKDKKAREFFATLTGSNRYAILYRIQDAKRPETRARRIAQFVEMLHDHKTIY
jgi:uncharacterized protein YdeI (YjbR/CyaY-like superfamily)